MWMQYKVVFKYKGTIISWKTNWQRHWIKKTRNYQLAQLLTFTDFIILLTICSVGGTLLAFQNSQEKEGKKRCSGSLTNKHMIKKKKQHSITMNCDFLLVE